MITQMNLKQMFLGTINTGMRKVYTVQSGITSAVVKELVVYNNSGETAQIGVYVNGIQLVNQAVEAGDSLFSDKTWYLVFKTGDTVSIETDKDNINAFIVGAETIEVADK